MEPTIGIPTWKYSNRITRRELNRAIYFDFEGRMNEPPVLLGAYSRGWFRQFVFDSTFAPLVKTSRAAGYRVFHRKSVETVVETELLGPAERDDLRLIAFSEHELRAVHDLAGPRLALRMSERFLNARRYAAAWVGRDRPDIRSASDPASLADFAALFGFEWPEEYDVQPAETILRLRRRLQTSRRKNRAPDERAVEAWARLLEYNKYDCLAAKHIVREIASATSARSSGRSTVRTNEDHAPGRN